MEGYYCYHHMVKQTWINEFLGSLEQDMLWIIIMVFKATAISMNRARFEKYKTAEIAFKVKYSQMKQQLIDNRDGDDNMLRAFITHQLRGTGVPRDEHNVIIQDVFNVLENAESPVEPVKLIIWDTTYPPQYVDPENNTIHVNYVPASVSSILALQRETPNGDEITAQGSRSWR